MTRKQFEKFRVEIEAQKFQSVEMNPITYGIHRLVFEKEKLKVLIAAAEAIPMKTTRAKADRWKRKLQRADSSLVRLQNTQTVDHKNVPLKSLDVHSLKSMLNRSQPAIPVTVPGNVVALRAARAA